MTLRSTWKKKKEGVYIWLFGPHCHPHWWMILSMTRRYFFNCSNWENYSFFRYWSYPEKISKYFLPAQPTFIIIYQFSYIDIALYLQHFSRLEIASRFETSKRILNMIELSERCGGHQGEKLFHLEKKYILSL